MCSINRGKTVYTFVDPSSPNQNIGYSYSLISNQMTLDSFVTGKTG